MLRKTSVALAISLVLGGSALASSAFDRGSGYGGGSGLGGGGIRGNHLAGAFGGGHIIRDRGGRVSGLRGGFHGYRRRDVWGHWGGYYGPMI